MKRIKISKKFRLLFSEKLMDLGNISAGGLVFGQFISGNNFSMLQLIFGILLLIVLYVSSFEILRR